MSFSILFCPEGLPSVAPPPPASPRIPSPLFPFHSGDPCSSLFSASSLSCPLFLSCLSSTKVLLSLFLSPWPALPRLVGKEEEQDPGGVLYIVYIFSMLS